jgi:hypothetical protein
MAKTFVRYQWTSIWLCVGTALGLTGITVFAVTTGLNFGLLMLWSLAYLVIGALFGFIFSVPKLISDTKVSTVDTSNLTGDTLEKANVAALKSKVQENTNLTQISDWLTKVIIGATLVQIKEVPKFILKVATVMGKGVLIAGTAAANGSQATVACAAIILFFSTWGFICGYLVMKLVLTEQFADIGT